MVAVFFSRPSASSDVGPVMLASLRGSEGPTCKSGVPSFPRGRLLLLSRSYRLCKVCYFRSKIGFLEVIRFHQSAVTSSVNTSEPLPLAVYVEAIFGCISDFIFGMFKYCTAS